MNANERFEYMAELFYREYAILAPGKDDPLRLYQESERYRLWDEFKERFYSDLFELHKSNANCIENN